MFLDALLRVSSGQQVTADAVSTNTIDLGDVTPKREIGTGEPLGFGVVVTAKGTHSGSVRLQAIQSTAANLSSPDVITEIALASGDVVVGAMFFVPLRPGMPTKQYIGMNHDITGTVDYTVTAWLTSQKLFSIQAKAYADAITIS